MKIENIKHFLPEINDVRLQQTLDKYFDFLNNLVKLGGNIIQWDIEYIREGTDNNIPTLFLRNFIELADSISILTSKSSIDPSKILIRSLIENSLSLLYMIEDNIKSRELSYIVWKTNKDISYFKQFISNSESHEKLKNSLKEDNNESILDNSTNNPMINEIIKNKLELLKQPNFKKIQQNYLKTRGKSRRVNHWYNLYNGPKNFYELCKKLNKTVIYDFFYREYSENVHASDTIKGFAPTDEDGQAQLIQIRDFEGCDRLFNTTATTILETYSKFVYNRLPEKHEEYMNYHKSFTSSFEELKKIKINYSK
jgi:hypothetical protein